MIPINICNNDIIIKNIEANELKQVLECVNESADNYKALGRDKPMTCDEIEQRYLESLMNSLEFFCGIYLNNKIIGIIKGRIENKNDRELWLLSYLFLEKYRKMGNGTKVLKIFEEYFLDNYSINKFCILIMENNENAQSFWAKNGYLLTRVTKLAEKNNFSEMVILEKKGIKRSGQQC